MRLRLRPRRPAARPGRPPRPRSRRRRWDPRCRPRTSTSPPMFPRSSGRGRRDVRPIGGSARPGSVDADPGRPRRQDLLRSDSQVPIQGPEERLDAAGSGPEAAERGAGDGVHAGLGVDVQRYADLHPNQTRRPRTLRFGLHDSFAIVPTHDLPTLQSAVGELHGRVPHPDEGNGVGATRQVRIGGPCVGARFPRLPRCQDCSLRLRLGPTRKAKSSGSTTFGNHREERRLGASEQAPDTQSCPRPAGGSMPAAVARPASEKGSPVAR